MTEKQKNFLRHNELEYGSTKDEAKYLVTSSIKNKQFTKKFNSILDAWKYTKNYPQTSTGLNHFQRDVFIADFDGNVTDFHNVFDSLSIPHYSYLLVNPSSGHCQCGWILDKPMYWNDYDETVHIQFNEIKNIINSYCPDNGFTGWRCKNPFYEEFNVEWFNTSVNRNEFINSILKIKKQIKQKKNNNSIKQTNNNYQIQIEHQSKKGSRHQELLKLIREYTWEQMNKGITPTLEHLILYAQTHSWLIAKKANKENEEFTMEEIEKEVRNCWKWAIEVYNKNISIYSNNDRNLSQLFRHLRSIYNFILVNEIKGSQREIAAKLGLSVGIVNKNLNRKWELEDIHYTLAMFRLDRISEPNKKEMYRKMIKKIKEFVSISTNNNYLIQIEQSSLWKRIIVESNTTRKTA